MSPFSLHLGRKQPGEGFEFLKAFMTRAIQATGTYYLLALRSLALFLDNLVFVCCTGTVLSLQYGHQGA